MTTTKNNIPTINHLAYGIHRDRKILAEIIKLGGTDTFGLESSIERERLMVLNQKPTNFLEALSKFELAAECPYDLEGDDGIDDADECFREDMEFLRTAIIELYDFVRVPTPKMEHAAALAGLEAAADEQAAALNS